MKNILSLSLFLAIGFISCKNSEKNTAKETSLLQITNQYYEALDNSDSSSMLNLVADSIVIRENADNYEERFSKKAYTEWLEWESVFDPTYKILDIKREGEVVEAKISKIDKRIFFLTEEPIVWNEVIHFNNNKIIKVERIEYEIFDIEKFLKKRDALVIWIDKNQPELSGFLYPQTKAVGMKYLEAIQLYQSKN